MMPPGWRGSLTDGFCLTGEAVWSSRERRYIASATRWLSEGRWRQADPVRATVAQTPHVETVWISATSPEWRAWADHWRATKGKSPPVDAKGGWRFPSQYPPASLEQAA